MLKPYVRAGRCFVCRHPASFVPSFGSVWRLCSEALFMPPVFPNWNRLFLIPFLFLLPTQS